MKKLILWGAKGQARVLLDCFGDRYKLVALVDNSLGPFHPPWSVPILHGLGGLADWIHLQDMEPLYYNVAIGGPHGEYRCKFIKDMSELGLKIARAFHETAYVEKSSNVSDRSQMLAWSHVGSNCHVAEGCILNTKSSVDHDCVLEPGVHIGPGATVCGNVSIGKYSFIGAGATILPNLVIRPRATIGAGAVVTKSTEPFGEYVGVPAVRTR